MADTKGKGQGARCPMCGSEMGKSPLGQAAMEQIAQKAGQALQRKGAPGAGPPGAGMRPGLPQGMRQGMPPGPGMRPGMRRG